MMATTLNSNSPTKKQLIENPISIINTMVFLKVDVSDTNNGEISELSLFAYHLNELTRVHDLGSNMDLRVVDKLTLCFDTINSYNMHSSWMMNTDQLLVQQAKKKKFDQNAINLMHKFLKRQQGPICFICHNGFRMDFQFLQSAIKRFDRKCSLDRINDMDVYCADTLWTCKAIDLHLSGMASSIKTTDVTVFDMLQYNLSSVVARYLNKLLPQQLNAENTNMYLVELFLNQPELFSRHLCCKPFALVRAGVVKISETKISYPKNTTQLDENSIGNDTMETYVFFDLETTALHNAKITEICLSAVNVSSLLDTEPGLMPRIQDKMLMVVDPDAPIEPDASQISGLSNDLITNSVKPTFDTNTAWAIAQFLNQQSGNICLVAHNGNRFDFPLLKKALSRYYKLFDFPRNLFSSDSLRAMRAFYCNETDSQCLSQSSDSCSQSSQSLLQSSPTSLESLESFLDSSQSSLKPSPSLSQSQSKRRTRKSIPSCALKNVYERYFPGDSQVFYNAEAGVDVLIKIFCSNKEFLQYLNQYKAKFPGYSIL